MNQTRINAKLIFSWHPFHEEQPADDALRQIQGQRKQSFVGPWSHAKFIWLMHHYPYGTALRIEAMARHLGVGDPAIAVAFDDGNLAVICGGWGIIVLEVKETTEGATA